MFNFKIGSDNNQDVNIVATKGPFSVIEYARDLSVTPAEAAVKYFMGQMNCRRRQVICNLAQSGNGVTVQAGAMQWMLGDCQMSSGVKGAGDFLGKALSSLVTNESAVKPTYKGSGTMMLEPTYKHIILLDTEDWQGSVVLDDGLFLACDSNLKLNTIARKNLSSAVLGNEGLFNTEVRGKGILCLESVSPVDELIEIQLDNDTLKVDGNMAIAWSGSLDFSVEKAGASLMGSAVSGEGFVNVYRGTGKVLLAPVTGQPANRANTNQVATAQGGSQAAGMLGSFISGMLD